MTPNQLQFMEFIKKHNPELLRFWDWEDRSFLADLVEKEMGVLSTGEQHMLKFYLGIWRHKNEFGFDLIQAGLHLDSANYAAITAWVNDPIWP